MKIISGGQTGADIAALITAKKFNLATGGWIPKGFKTLIGPKPEYQELYNLQEHSSASYPPRTFLNVKNSDATLRFAWDFNSSGEKCTLKAIFQYNKLYLDVNLKNSIRFTDVVDWIIIHNLKVLNVAGNSEKTYSGMTVFVIEYLTEVFNVLKNKNYI